MLGLCCNPWCDPKGSRPNALSNVIYLQQSHSDQNQKKKLPTLQTRPEYRLEKDVWNHFDLDIVGFL